jgi:integrase
MAVRDLWHYVNVEDAIEKGVQPCKCARGKTPWYPTLDHLKGQRWRVELYFKGKRRGKYEHFDEYGDAKDYYNALLADLKKGRKPVDKTKEKEPLRSHLEEYIGRTVSKKGRPISNGTRRTFTSYLNNQIIPYFGEEATLGDITADRVESFRDHMTVKRKRSGQPYSRTMVADVYGLLASALKYAVHQRKLVENPTALVTYPKFDMQDKFTVWEAGLVKRILAVLPAYDRVIAQVSATCGHRQGEAFGVCVEDIRGDHISVLHQVIRDDDRVLRLGPTKHSSARFRVPLPAVTARALVQHMRDHEPLPVTCTCHPGKTWHLVFSRRGRPMVAQTWNSTVWWPALAAAAASYAADGLAPPVDLDPKGDDETGMRQLRHHAISMWLYGRATMLAAAEWAGHRGTTMIERIYGHVFADEALRGRGIMDRVYGDEEPPGLTVIS